MKKIIISSFFAFGLLSPRITQAQGITYLSNLGQASTGSGAVGSDSWLAESFFTGNNAGGYVLNSVQLGMVNASGNPSGFTLMLYSSTQAKEFYPANSLGSLSGSTDPATGGIFTFSPASSLMLSPGTVYFLVLTSGTAVANGAYEWSFSNGSYGSSGAWAAPVGLSRPDSYISGDGSTWTFSDMTPQFGISATAVPEPTTYALLGLGLLCLSFWRRNPHDK